MSYGTILGLQKYNKWILKIKLFLRYGEPTVEGYYKKISQAFVSLRLNGSSSGNYEPVILFDGANGVGALAMEEFMKHLQDTLKVTIYNKDGILNHMCGADHVKASCHLFSICCSLVCTFHTVCLYYW